MTLSPEQRGEIVRLRIDNSSQALDDAKLLFSNNSLRSAINRAYYTMFYAIAALAIADGKSFRKHTQLIGFFQKEYTKPEIFDRKYGRAIQKAFEDRSEADYQDYIHITAEQVNERLEEAEEFLEAVQSYLKF